MKHCIGAIAAISILLAGTAGAADKGTPDEAVAMVKKAAAYLKANGKEKAFAEFANPANTTFHDRDLYVYVYDFNGMNQVHGNNPKMTGKNMLELKDSEGKAIVRGFIDAANSPAGKGWVDYKWVNPTTGKMEAKSGYVEKVDNLIVGSGVYK